MRDIIKTAEQGSKLLAEHRKADLSLSEVNCIYKEFASYKEEHSVHDAIIRIIELTYFMGVAVGYRNAAKWNSN